MHAYRKRSVCSYQCRDSQCEDLVTVQVGDGFACEAERMDGTRSNRSSSMVQTAFNGSHLQYFNPPGDNADTLAQGLADMYFPEHSAAESSGGRMHDAHYMWQPYVGRPCEPAQHAHQQHLDTKMSTSDDPLMCSVAPTAHSVPVRHAFHAHQLPMMPPGSCPTMPPPPRSPSVFTGGFPYVSSNPGGQTAAKRAKESVKDRAHKGPLASPNTHTALLPKNRHMAYPKTPCHLVQPLPESDSTATQGMDAADQGLADCALPLTSAGVLFSILAVSLLFFKLLFLGRVPLLLS